MGKYFVINTNRIVRNSSQRRQLLFSNSVPSTENNSTYFPFLTLYLQCGKAWCWTKENRPDQRGIETNEETSFDGAIFTFHDHLKHWSTTISDTYNQLREERKRLGKTKYCGRCESIVYLHFIFAVTQWSFKLTTDQLFPFIRKLTIVHKTKTKYLYI